MGQLETQAYLTVGMAYVIAPSQCCAQMKTFWLIFKKKKKKKMANF